MAETDMETFNCPNECKKFCNKSIVCSIDQFWTKRLQGKTQPFSKFDGKALEIVEAALSKVPKGFKPSDLKAIVKASKTTNIVTGLSPATSSDEYLILFPSAFSKPADLPRIIVHELSHFLINREWKSLFKQYKTASGWDSLKNNEKYRSGDFVDSDGKFSPEEDFANNIEFYIFEDEKLKSVSPQIFSWMKRKLGSQLKMEKGCSL